jgi:hypothetical protein
MTITNPSHSIKYHLVEIAGTILRRLECVVSMRREWWKAKTQKTFDNGKHAIIEVGLCCERSV